MTVDLHLHSTFSDGLLTPEQLCRLAVRRGCRVIALCDHDTTDGLAALDAAREAVNAEGKALTVLPSVEISAGPDGRTHILGYGVSADNPALRDALTLQRKRRHARDELILQKLSQLGCEVPRSLLPQDERFPLGRAHIARAMVQAGQAATVAEAFERYLGDGKPANVPFERFSATEAVALLRQAHAVPVLAHPARMGVEPQMLEALLDALTEAGLMGLEAYHPSASRQQARALNAVARRRGLLVTGGSDYHGDRGSKAHIGGAAPGWERAAEDVAALMDAMARSQTNEATRTKELTR